MQLGTRRLLIDFAGAPFSLLIHQLLFLLQYTQAERTPSAAEIDFVPTRIVCFLDRVRWWFRKVWRCLRLGAPFLGHFWRYYDCEGKRFNDQQWWQSREGCMLTLPNGSKEKYPAFIYPGSCASVVVRWLASHATYHSIDSREAGKMWYRVMLEELALLCALCMC